MGESEIKKIGLIMEENTNHFESLPLELLEEILSYFKITKELKLLSLVCHQWKNVIDSQHGAGLNKRLILSYDKVKALNAFDELKNSGRNFTGLEVGKSENDSNCFKKTLQIISFLNLERLILVGFTTKEAVDILKLVAKTVTKLELNRLISVPDNRKTNLKMKKLQSLLICNSIGKVPSNFLNYFTNIECLIIGFEYDTDILKILAYNSKTTLKSLNLQCSTQWSNDLFQPIKDIKTLKVLQYIYFGLELANPTAVKQVFENLKFVEDMDLINVHIPEEILRNLYMMLPNLKNLKLNYMNNELASVLQSHLPFLRAISCRKDSNMITSNICPNNYLTFLNVDSKYRNLLPLLVQKLPSINHFCYTILIEDSIDFQALKTISTWKTLETLNVHFQCKSRFHIANHQQTVSFPELKRLRLRNSCDMNHLFKHLDIPKVVDICFSHCSWEVKSKGRCLVDIFQLTHLLLERCSSLKCTESYPKLKLLNIVMDVEDGIQFIKNVRSKWFRGVITLDDCRKYNSKEEMIENWNKIVEDIATFHGLKTEKIRTESYHLENDGISLNLNFEQTHDDVGSSGSKQSNDVDLNLESKIYDGVISCLNKLFKN